MTDKARSAFWKSFGPGMLFAGAAVGTSHLVQSTRAGAMFGLGLLSVVILTNLIKYPAYRFGSQYAAATDKSLIEGYRGIGRWVVGLYLLSEVPVIMIIIAATGVTTAAILLAVTGLGADARYVGIGLIALAIVALKAGGYKLLDRLTKVFVLILTVATLTAAVLSLPRIDWSPAGFLLPELDAATFAFVIALMGFMPAGMDLSVMQSLWVAAKRRTTGVHPDAKHVLADFNVGYLGSALLAICFVLMGAGVMHSAGVQPATGAAPFAQQVIALYTTNLGNWAGTLVGVSALFVMFTTLITILDGMPRLSAACILSWQDDDHRRHEDLDGSPLLLSVTLALAAGAVLVLLFFMQGFQRFIDFVTITTFIVAPITAVLNHLVMFADDVPVEGRPSDLLRIWSLAGVTILIGLSLVFLYVRFLAN